MYTNQKQNKDTKELRRLGGRWLKERRESAGLSQRQLAEILGVEYYTFISQIETGHGRIPPDRYEAWAGAVGLELADFVREILRYYDPVTFSILFEASDQPGAASPSGRPATAAGEGIAAENRRLQDQIRELQRLLGKKTMELEQMREGQTRQGKAQHGNADEEQVGEEPAAGPARRPAGTRRPPAAGRKPGGVPVAGGVSPYGDAGD